MYGYPNMNNMYNSQNSIDKINTQLAELERMKQQLQQAMQPAINQTFQLAPQNNPLKIVDKKEDVEKELAVTDTPFVNKDYSILWIKNNKGEIRTFNIQEVKPKDEKDALIENLQYQVYQLNTKLEAMNNEKHTSEQYNESTKTETTSTISDVTTDDTE